jgi:hypothetical protein
MQYFGEEDFLNILGRPIRRRDDNIKMDFGVVVVDDRRCKVLAQILSNKEFW